MPASVSHPDVTSDAADHHKDTGAGVAGLMDDLSAHALTVPDQTTGAEDKERTQVPGRFGAVAKQIEAISQEGRERTTEAAEQAGINANTAETDPSDTGSDIAGTIRDGGESARDDISGAAIDNAERTRGSDGEAAATIEDVLNRAGDRLEQTADDVEQTSEAAASVISGTNAGAASEIRHHLTESARDPLSIGRDPVGESQPVAGETVGDLRSTIPERAGLVAGIGRSTAEAIAHRVGQTARSVTGAASEAESTVAGAIRGGLGGGIESSFQDHRRAYTRLIVSAVALGTVSGLNRWAVRRLTGADVALLGPATVHPAILGTGLATLIASLYLYDDQSSQASEAASRILSQR